MSHRIAAVVMAVLLALAGCAGVPGGSENASGTVSFYVSDQPNAIDDFEHLNVTITGVALSTEAVNNSTNASEESWETYEVNATVDLTEYRGANATRIGNLSVPTGEYETVKIDVSAVEGTLDDGSAANVKLPSGGLTVPKGMTVEADESLDFVFDVSVVKAGGSGRYILKPVVGESGTDVPIEPRGQQDRERGGDSAGGNAPDARMNVYLSDEANAIGEFERLNVTVTQVGLHAADRDAANESDGGNETAADSANETDSDGANGTDATGSNGTESAGWQNYEVNETTVDLTEYRGANATLLDTLDVPSGTYDKVFVHVSEVDGTLTTGEEVNVKLPSEKLHINSAFTAGANESVDFVFDISVFKAGNSGKYILKPVVSESGTDVPIETNGQGETERNGARNTGGNETSDGADENETAADDTTTADGNQSS